MMNRGGGMRGRGFGRKRPHSPDPMSMGGSFGQRKMGPSGYGEDRYMSHMLNQALPSHDSRSRSGGGSGWPEYNQFTSQMGSYGYPQGSNSMGRSYGSMGNSMGRSYGSKGNSMGRSYGSSMGRSYGSKGNSMGRSYGSMANSMGRSYGSMDNSMETVYQQMQNRPGVPPSNVFNKKSRGGGRGGTVAPVHSLAKASTVDPTAMSNTEKIRQFCLFLQNDSGKINEIQTIENGLSSSKLMLKPEYIVEELMKVGKQDMFTGSLKLSGVFLARSVGASKKEVKHETYKKALNILKTKNVAEIFSLVDTEPKAIRHELEVSLAEKQEPTNYAVYGVQLAQQAMSKASEKIAEVGILRKGLSALINYYSGRSTLPDNPVNVIEQGILASKSQISHAFECQDVRLPNRRHLYRGQLLFEGVVIARGTGSKKKECKVETYKAAWDNMKNKTIEELVMGLPEEDFSKYQMDGSYTAKPGKKDEPLKDRLDELIQQLSGSANKDSLNTLDMAAMRLALTPTYLYKELESPNPEDHIICELYLDVVHVASGEGTRRKDCQMDAYHRAWEVLTTTTSEELMTQHKRLSPDYENDPTVVDVWVKGRGMKARGHFGESNITGLRRYKLDPNDPGRTVESMVILEHTDWTVDRKRNAFCILQYSATLNGMLLQWSTEGQAQNFKSTITLQKQHVYEACALNKNLARSLAAADALFRFYETQEVISVGKRDDSKLWIEWETVQAEGEALRAQAGEPKPEVKPIDNDPLSLPPVDKFVIKAIEKRIHEYCAKTTLEELIFGPGIPLSKTKEVCVTCREKNPWLRCDTRQHMGEDYLLIFIRYSPQEMVQILKNSEGVSGKYALVNKDLLPTHADIEQDIKQAAHESKMTMSAIEAKAMKR